MTIDKIYRNVSSLLKDSVDDEGINASLIISDVIGIGRNELVLNNSMEINSAQVKKIYRLAALRKKKLPLSWVLKSHNFCGMELLIKNGVFVPRPETEELAEMVLKQMTEEKISILDFCAGSGAIGFYLAYSNKSASVYAIEKLKNSYSIMIENKKRFNLNNYFPANSSRIDFFRRKFDILVSNPPYIPSYMYESLPDDVRLEPKSALISGDDGLLMIKYIFKNLNKVLKKNGIIFIEIGEYYTEKLIKILLSSNLKSFEILKDFNKKDRFIKAVYNG
ncbi:MAG: peptide chain release factor N(5)-glutamine methyltransferase [Elusimicrobiales bacterium]|jgi:release factor-specific protein-(glutamine-N5) methyltransferase|nr:peptide chain release factor N(5)-glutamine methyltransferase [Elusimicrobiales bacterium]